MTNIDLKKMKKSRAKFKCDPKLDELIKKANQLPYERNPEIRRCLLKLGVRTWELEKFEKLDSQINYGEKRNWAEATELRLNAISELPDDAKSYIYSYYFKLEPIIIEEINGPSFKPENPQSEQLRKVKEDVKNLLKASILTIILEELFDVRELFLQLSQISPKFISTPLLKKHIHEISLENLSDNYITENGKPMFQRIEDDPNSFLSTPSSNSITDYFKDKTPIVWEKDIEGKLQLDENGDLSYKLPIYIESLKGINVSRIRQCEICSNIFWATRKDAFTCSKKHANTRRMQLHRRNWNEKSDQYLEARLKKKKRKSYS